MVLVDTKLKISQKWALVANEGNSILDCTKECCHSMSGEVILLLYLALLSSYMEWQVQFLASQCKRHGHTGERPEKHHEGEEEDEPRLLSEVTSDKIKVKGHKLKPRKYHLDIRKCFGTARITNHWHKLPREAVSSSFAKVLKGCLHIITSNYYLQFPSKMTPFSAAGLRFYLSNLSPFPIS